MKPSSDKDIKPGMIVVLNRGDSERWEVLEVHGDIKLLLRRDDLDRANEQSVPERSRNADD